MERVLWGTSGTCPECGARQLNNTVVIECDHEWDCDCKPEIHYPACGVCDYRGEYN